MQSNLPLIELNEILTERKEKPDIEALLNGEIPIIAKIGFNTGNIEFRNDIGTKTNMILVRPGDIVVSGINAEKGAIALYDENNSNDCAATIHYSSYSINKDLADPKFLWFFFRSEKFKQILINSLPSGIKTELKPFRLLKLKIPCPPLKIQQNIVINLEYFLSKIEIGNREQVNAIEESRKLWRQATAKILKELPPDYWRSLEDVIEIHGGCTPSKSNPAFFDGDIPWIRPQNMKMTEIFHSSDYISKLAIDNSSLNIYQPGTILIVIRGMILVHTVPIAILRVPATINQDMKALIPNKDIMPEYLSNILWALNQEILQLVEKSGHDTRRIPTEKLLSMKIPVPPLIQQRRIVDYFNRLKVKVDEINRLHKETQREMEALVPALFSKVFS